MRWVPLSEQMKNRRNVYRITLGGVTKCLADWSRETGIGRERLKTRIERMPIELALDPAAPMPDAAD